MKKSTGNNHTAPCTLRAPLFRGEKPTRAEGSRRLTIASLDGTCPGVLLLLRGSPAPVPPPPGGAEAPLSTS